MLRASRRKMFRAKTLFSIEHKVRKPKPVKESPFSLGYAMFQLDPIFDYGVPIDSVFSAVQPS